MWMEARDNGPAGVGCATLASCDLPRALAASYLVHPGALAGLMCLPSLTLLMGPELMALFVIHRR